MSLLTLQSVTVRNHPKMFFFYSIFFNHSLYDLHIAFYYIAILFEFY